MAPHAHGSQVGEVFAAVGFGLDDVIDLAGLPDADVGVAQLALVAQGSIRAGCGPKGIRTPDLLAASQTLYQLSYGPAGGSV
jgi:hypothetical protein